MLEPTEETLTPLHAGPEGPVVMLNLLRYTRDEDGSPVGAAKYQEYAAAVAPILETLGAEAVWVGRGDSVVIGDEADRWDTVLLIKYPSRSAFLGMITSAEYLEIHPLRAGALEDSRLIATTEGVFA